MRLELKTLTVIREGWQGTSYVRFYDAYMRYSGPDGVCIYVLPLFRYPGLSRTMYEN